MIPGCEIGWAVLADYRPDEVALLDDAERQRLAGIRVEDDRRRFVLGCVLVRRRLGEQLGVRPRDVPLDRTCPACRHPHGKPEALVDGALRFSVSHSRDRVGVAFAHGDAVGFDVEWHRPGVDIHRLAGRIRSAAEVPDASEPSPDPVGAFFRTWTRKEAVLKATGEGLRRSPAAVTLTSAGEPPALLGYDGYDDLVARAALADADPGPEYSAAVCVIAGA